MARITLEGKDESKGNIEKDALIYQKNHDAAKKHTFKELSGKEKWQYYKDYYLLRTLAVVGAVAAAAALLYSIFKPRAEVVVYTVMENINMDALASPSFLEGFMEEYSLDEKDYEVNFDDNFHSLSDGYATQRISAYLYSELIDLYIGERKDFRKFALNGNLTYLNEVLPKEVFDALEDRLLYIHDEEYDEDVPLGISLAGCEKYKKLDPYSEEPYIGIVCTTKHLDYAIGMIEYLFDLPSTVTLPVPEEN